MAQAQKKQAVNEVSNINHANVRKLLKAASIGASTMVDKTRQAAQAAASDLPKKGTAKARVDYVVKIYAKDFTKLDKNVKSLFVNYLTVMCVPDMPIQVAPAKGKTGAVVQKASQAISVLSKHAAQQAAKTIRDQEGTGRAEKANAKIAPKANVISAEANFYTQLKAHLADKDAMKRIRSILAEAGYELRKVTASKPAVKAAKAEPKPLPAITDPEEVDPPTLTNDDKAKLAGGIPAAE